MKPDAASRVLYQQAALRSFLRSDSIAQSFIENTPNYAVEDLEQLYFASASIKSKKMLIEFVKISTKQLCIALRDKLPLFKYLNPENISTDLTDDELMLLIHEASHSMSLDKFSSGHGNIAFLVAKNIIFNLVGVNATATLNSLLKTPDNGPLKSKNELLETKLPSSSFAANTQFPSPVTFPSQPATQSTTVTSSPLAQYHSSIMSPSSSLTTTLSTLTSSFTPSSPTIISTSVANVSFVSINSSLPQGSNSFATTSTIPSELTTYSLTQSTPIPAIEPRTNMALTNFESEFDSVSIRSGPSSTRFEVIDVEVDDDGANIQNDTEEDGLFSNENHREVDIMSDDSGLDRSEQSLEKYDSDSQMVDNDDYEEANKEIEQKSLVDEIIDDNVIKHIFSFSRSDDEYENPGSSHENDHEDHVQHDNDDINVNAYPDTSPPVDKPPKKSAPRKKATKRKANHKDDDYHASGTSNNMNDAARRSDIVPEPDFESDSLLASIENDFVDDGNQTLPGISELLNQRPFGNKASEMSTRNLLNFNDLITDLKHNETNIMNMAKSDFSDAKVSFANIDA